MLKIRLLPICLLFVGSLLAGCQTNTQTGALLGTGIGSGVGAIIGHQIGKGKEGALLGAGAGALTGTLLGQKKDMQEQRDSAIHYANHQEMARKASDRAVTNDQVVGMTRNGLSDSLILSSIQSRGGRFDTSPNAIIGLHEQGVSEMVIQAMQQYQ